MNAFTVYPAIDLRGGQVVRLVQGDPAQQTVYDDDPAQVAQRWCTLEAQWLHVVNLDGAFGEDAAANHLALQTIIDIGIRVQFGGGLRALADIEAALALGVERVVLGTVAFENESLVAEAITRFGSERIVVGLDARDGRVRVRGWVQDTRLAPQTIATRLKGHGLTTVVYTNIARDGVGGGVDLKSTCQLAAETGLDVIASGGVASLADIRAVQAAGLAGVIVGRALYEGQIDLAEALAC